MKKILSIFLVVVVAICSLHAQDAEMMQKAMERFKNMTTLTADVTQTKHNSMVAKDIVSKGNFYFKKPNKMSMTFNEGKDMMLMDGETFTIVKDGVRNTAKGDKEGRGGKYGAVLRKHIQYSAYNRHKRQRKVVDEIYGWKKQGGIVFCFIKGIHCLVVYFVEA